MKRTLWIFAFAAFILPQAAIAQEYGGEDEWADEAPAQPAPARKKAKAKVQPVVEEDAEEAPAPAPKPRRKVQAAPVAEADEYAEPAPQPRRQQRVQPAYNNYNRQPRANYNSGGDEKRVKFLLDLRPGNFGMADGLEGFEVSGVDCYGLSCYSYTDTVTSGFMWLPTINAGVGINTPMMEIDVTAGFGFMMAGGMVGYTLQGDVAARFKLGEKATIGPHLGLMYISPTWYGGGYTTADDITIEGASGIMVGGSLTAGKKVAFVASIDKLMMSEMAVTANSLSTYDYVVAPTTLDLSGWLVQLGIMFRFGN